MSSDRITALEKALEVAPTTTRSGSCSPRCSRARPAERLDLKKLARMTPLFSGADLRALVEQAFDRVIKDVALFLKSREAKAWKD